MLDYNGVKCPVCGVPFQEDDDIVVCPECGAPYHRECYHQAGECIFEDLHKEGKEWAPPEAPKVPESDAEIKDRECPKCGLLNSHSTLFCNRCGTFLLDPAPLNRNTAAGNSPFSQENPTAQERPDADEGPAAPPFAPHPPFRTGMSFGAAFFDPMGGVSPADELDSGVTFGDASKLVRQNTGYYMPVFRYIKQTGKNKFNGSAFLFSGAWMLYRKQYKLGAIITSLMFFLYLAFQGAFLLLAYPTMAALAIQAGYDPAELYLFTDEQIRAISALAMQNSGDVLKIMSPLLVLVLIFICMLVIGVRGNKMYLKHCVSTVRAVKEEGADGDPGMTLQEQGGVSPTVALFVGILFFVLRTVLTFLL